MVSREELRRQIWQTDTFVDFDNGLNTSINRLREALGDSAHNPRFVETLPRRGYRFIAPVTQNGTQTSYPASGDSVWRYRTATLLAVVTLSVVALLGFAWRWRWPHKPRLTEKGTIVLADFSNTTGDPLFDGTLRQGLAVQLEQSPFVSLVSDEQIQQTLRLMKQPVDAKLTPEITLEVCQRTNSAMVMEGSIAQFGPQYSLILRAVDCANGETLASGEAQASDKRHVLETLGKVSSAIRKTLGESLVSVQKFDTPLVQATTPSLEALQAYSLGYKAVTRQGDSAAAKPLIEHAIELDPNFAMAYVLLGGCQWNLGENTLAAQSIQKAFELHSGVSEWERLRIESEYHCLVTCDLFKAQRALEAWAQTYPRDWAPRNRLGVVYSALGQYDKALDVFRTALRLYPQSALIRGNVIYSYIELNRLAEAHTVAQEAKTTDPDSPQLQVALYRLAFLEGDHEGMERQVASAAGKAGIEDVLLWNEAATAAHFGQLKKARLLFGQAAASALRADETEAAAGYRAGAAVTAALFGDDGEARRWAASALHLANGPDIVYEAALALALAGDTPRAQALSEALSSRSPKDTVVQYLYVPTLRAQVGLNRNQAPRSLEILQVAAPYELGAAALFPAYVRGLADLAVHRGSEAASEFQKIVDHSGIVLNSPIGALARLQLARAYLAQGDRAKARTEYEGFLELWNSADQETPILRQASAEYARLASSR
jgi:Flp pilus assembly protein TadD